MRWKGHSVTQDKLKNKKGVTAFLQKWTILSFLRENMINMRNQNGERIKF
tara:strand:- start:246 stop:395 length:150 start_codon:yes stop_codon:yes gene_type:complete